MAKSCPVSGCPNKTSSNHLMCRFHWAQTPILLRRAVGRTWRAYLKSSGREEVLPAVKAYREASEEAIAHVGRAQAPVIP